LPRNTSSVNICRVSNSEAATSPRQSAGGWAEPEWLLAGTSVLVLVSLFLPWFGVHVGRGGMLGAFVVGHGAITGQISGVSAHGYLWIVFTLVLLTLALLVGRPALERPPVPGAARAQLSLPSLGQLLVAVAGLNFVITLVGVVSKPGGASLGILHISVGWRYGAVTALVLAALAVGAAVLILREPKSTNATAHGQDLS
jgi:hypothetical protein